MLEHLIKHGAETTMAVEASAHVILLEEKMSEMVDTLDRALGHQLKNAGDRSTEATEKLFASHREALEKLLKPFMDPNSKNGLPSFLTELLQATHRDALNRIQVMLNDSDEGALAKAVKQIVEEQKKAAAMILTALAERETLRTKSVQRGLCFEDQLAARLPF